MKPIVLINGRYTPCSEINVDTELCQPNIGSLNPVPFPVVERTFSVDGGPRRRFEFLTFRHRRNGRLELSITTKEA